MIKKKTRFTKKNTNTFSDSRLLEVLKNPLITEKATRITEHNQYMFKIEPTATKVEVKAAVEKFFKVKVKSVNTLKNPGKTKVFRGRKGTRSDLKKAIVTLESGQNIDLTARI